MRMESKASKGTHALDQSSNILPLFAHLTMKGRAKERKVKIPVIKLYFV